MPYGTNLQVMWMEKRINFVFVPKAKVSGSRVSGARVVCVYHTTCSTSSTHIVYVHDIHTYIHSPGRWSKVEERLQVPTYKEVVI